MTHVYLLEGSPIDDVDVAGLRDAEGDRYLITAPRSAAGGAALEAELRVLEMLRGADSLSSLVERSAGLAHLPEGGRAHVTHALPGAPLSLPALEASPELAGSLGRTLARVHNTPVSVADAAGLPSYSPGEVRRRLRARVERADSQHSLPLPLVSRWQRQLDDDSLWGFSPCFIHGDLGEDRVLVSGDRVTGLRGWGSAEVADPAEDFGWLLAALPEDVYGRVSEAYANARATEPDAELGRRAQLMSELAILTWLLHGLAASDESIVQDADTMLFDLNAFLEESARAAAEQELDRLDDEV